MCYGYFTTDSSQRVSIDCAAANATQCLVYGLVCTSGDAACKANQIGQTFIAATCGTDELCSGVTSAAFASVYLGAKCCATDNCNDPDTFVLPAATPATVPGMTPATAPGMTAAAGCVPAPPADICQIPSGSQQYAVNVCGDVNNSTDAIMQLMKSASMPKQPSTDTPACIAATKTDGVACYESVLAVLCTSSCSACTPSNADPTRALQFCTATCTQINSHCPNVMASCATFSSMMMCSDTPTCITPAQLVTAKLPQALIDLIPEIQGSTTAPVAGATTTAAGATTKKTNVATSVTCSIAAIVTAVVTTIYLA